MDALNVYNGWQLQSVALRRKPARRREARLGSQAHSFKYVYTEKR
jgi:hypothetical protein